MKKTLLFKNVEVEKVTPKGKGKTSTELIYKVTLKNGQTFNLTESEYKSSMMNG